MGTFLRRRWFLIAILCVIPLGIRTGWNAPPATVSNFPKTLVQVLSGGMTALILFLMAVTLENRRLWASLRHPGPVIWGMFICFGAIPLLALLLLRWQQLPDFRIGLMVAAAIPSTLAAASVWTRKAGGNDAVSLVVTVISNGTCFFVTPLWLQIGLGDSVQLETGALMRQLFLTALLPILVGQGFRLWPWFRKFADRAKTGFGAVAQVCILGIVFWASVQSGVKLHASQSGEGGLQWQPILVVWASCLALHLCGLLTAIFGGRCWGMARADTVGAAFSGSQKTLPIGLFVAAGLAHDAPFALLPILMYHASQLVLDTLILEKLQLWIADEISKALSHSLADGGRTGGD